jgi:hypothetical protein
VERGVLRLGIVFFLMFPPAWCDVLFVFLFVFAQLAKAAQSFSS